MHATWYGDRSRSKRHCVGWGVGPSSLCPKREHNPQFSAHVSCGQTAGWIKMPLGMKVGLDPGLIVLHGDPAPQFSAHVYEVIQMLTDVTLHHSID